MPSRNPTTFLTAELTGPAGCRIARCDAWKPGHYRGAKFWYVISDYGGGYYVMRLFLAQRDQLYWVRRLRHYKAGHIQSIGTIQWKVGK
jgi:hypothetical protein